jgi:hypothetical protein
MRCAFVAPIVMAAAALLNAAPPVRLHHAIKGDDETFVLKGHRSARVALAQDLGETAGSLTLSNLALHFKMSPAQAADLDALLQAQRDRNNRWYHKWLTPEEFGQRFGVNDSDLKRVRDWLEDGGFSNVEIPTSRTMVRFSGQAADVRNAFGTSLHRYRQSGQ